jgi:hypothetical protein
MRIIHRNLALVCAVLLLCAVTALTQDDSPSLGDVARQTRAQKQQKDAQSAPDQAPQAQAKSPASKDAPASASASSAPANGGTPKSAPANTTAPKTTKHVITNEEINDPIAPSSASTASPKSADSSSQQSANSSQPSQSADQWRSQIVALKNNISSLQQQIGDLGASIQYAPGNCVSGCVEWNQHQQEKQQQLDGMKAQLEQQQKALEDAQDAARRDGYGSSVYDP